MLDFGAYASYADVDKGYDEPLTGWEMIEKCGYSEHKSYGGVLNNVYESVAAGYPVLESTFEELSYYADVTKEEVRNKYYSMVIMQDNWDEFDDWLIGLNPKKNISKEIVFNSILWAVEKLLEQEVWTEQELFNEIEEYGKEVAEDLYMDELDHR